MIGKMNIMLKIMNMISKWMKKMIGKMNIMRKITKTNMINMINMIVIKN